VGAGILLRLYSEKGDRIPNQLLLTASGHDSVDVFVSLWNHTNQELTIGLMALVDEHVRNMIIDGTKEVKMFTLHFGANEVAEIPVHLALADYSPGLHDLLFLVIRRPEEQAAQDPGATEAFVARKSLWLGMTEYVSDDSTDRGEAPYSLQIIEAQTGRGAIRSRAFTLSPVSLAVHTQAKTWKVVTLVHYNEVDLHEHVNPGDRPDSFLVVGGLPSVPPGTREVIAILVANPLMPITDHAGRVVHPPAVITQRVTWVTST